MKAFWIINLLLFQLSWFAAAKYTDVAAAVIFINLALHFVLSPSRRGDLLLILLVPIGIAVDQLMLSLQVFTSDSSLLPLWLALLWYMFILTFNHSLKWLMHQSLAVVALVGAVAGPLTYWVGIQAGGLGQGWPTPQMIAFLALVWSILLPVLAGCYRTLMAGMRREAGTSLVGSK